MNSSGLITPTLTGKITASRFAATYPHISIRWTLTHAWQPIRVSDIIALAAIAGVLILSWIILRPGPSTLTRLDDFQEALASTEPTLIEFQSEY